MILKDNIEIKGFDNKPTLKDARTLNGWKNGVLNILYQGKTSEISEELAKECVSSNINKFDGTEKYLLYGYDDEFLRFLCETAEESIQSACDKKYCIIYKT